MDNDSSNQREEDERMQSREAERHRRYPEDRNDPDLKSPIYSLNR
jgi:hypothetical protein